VTDNCRHPRIYFCPESGENECPDCGGFDVCCGNPEGHEAPKSDLDDDWTPPTVHTLGPLAFIRSNDGYGWTFRVGKRFQFRTRNGTTRMWPHISFNGNADENCNRAINIHCWPIGQVTVWWEPKWRTGTDGFCEDCRAQMREDGVCEWCGSRPCGCDVLGLTRFVGHPRSGAQAPWKDVPRAEQRQEEATPAPLVHPGVQGRHRSQVSPRRQRPGSGQPHGSHRTQGRAGRVPEGPRRDAGSDE